METSRNLPMGNQVAEITLSYSTIVSDADRVLVNCAGSAYRLLVQSWDRSKIEFVEQFKIILLNNAKKVLGICEISTGGTRGTVVDPKLVFAAALKCNAGGIILAHNHPTQTLNPSIPDKDLTAKLVKVGKLLDLPVVDHIIVALNGYYSFAESGDI